METIGIFVIWEFILESVVNKEDSLFVDDVVVNVEGIKEFELIVDDDNDEDDDDDVVVVVVDVDDDDDGNNDDDNVVDNIVDVDSDKNAPLHRNRLLQLHLLPQLSKQFASIASIW